MTSNLPVATNRVLDTPYGQALGSSFRWSGGQYCAIHAEKGLIGCGIYNPKVAGEFGQIVAIAKGTPQKPLCEPEDLYAARIVEVSEPAEKIGIRVGMTGMEALAKLLHA
jgi:uncharacterized protein YunC (DUF1805 family)